MNTIEMNLNIRKKILSSLDRGDFLILKNCIEFTYCRRPKTQAEKIESLIQLDLVESVHCEPHMIKQLRFKDEDSKEEFIKDYYWLKITETGLIVWALIDLYSERIKNLENEFHKKEKEYKKKVLVSFASMMEINKVEELFSEEENDDY